jgi:hypothetical protein
VNNCPQCNSPLDRRIVNTAAMTRCPKCKRPLRVDIFPAVTRHTGGNDNGNDLLQTGKEASCFYHPRKKAIVPCDACGRFLCALCDIDFNGRHMCPQCLETGKTKRKIKNLEDQRICYDTIAWLVALVPMLFFWFTIFTAPIVLFLVIRFWKSPLSIVPRTRIRFVAAFGLAVIQLAGWTLFIMNMFNQHA